jgi:hypothetical protein
MDKPLFRLTFVGSLLASTFVFGTLCGGTGGASVTSFGGGAKSHAVLAHNTDQSRDSQHGAVPRTFEVGISPESRCWSDWKAWTSPNVHKKGFVEFNAPSLEKLPVAKAPPQEDWVDGLLHYCLEWNDANDKFVFHKLAPPRPLAGVNGYRLFDDVDDIVARINGSRDVP